MSDHTDWLDKVLDFHEKTPMRDSVLLGLFANTLYTPCLKIIEKEFDVQRDEFNVLSTLAARGPSLATELCALNSRPRNSISRAVNRLTRRGAVHGKAVENDRRKELLVLTEIGQRLYDQTIPVFLERERELMSPLSYEERRTLESIMKKMLMDGPDWRRNI